MNDMNLEDIYNRIKVEIKENNPLDLLYNKIHVVINGVDNDNRYNKELDDLYKRITVLINNSSNNKNSTSGTTSTSGVTSVSSTAASVSGSSSNVYLNKLYEQIKVVINNTDINNDNEDTENIIQENDRFNEMLKDEFKSKLIKYIYLTFMANDIYIEVNHNNELQEKQVLGLIKDSPMLQEADLINNNESENEENTKLFKHIKKYTIVAMDKIKN
tara:strand:+ start:1031 stop:1678 length:648 start_codon:yes stop_codon:yes gene_type:complete